MKFLNNNPYVITLITIAVFLGVIKFPLEPLLDSFEFTAQQSDNIARILKNGILIVLALTTIYKLRIVKLAGLSTQIKLQHKTLILIPLYLLVLGIVQMYGLDLTSVATIDIALLVLAMLSVGFVEEFVFRGILQAVFLKKYIHHKNGIYISIFLPAFLFGALHLLNLDMNNIAASISQAIYAFFIGAAFGAIVLKTNKLVPLALLHGVIDIVFSLHVLTDTNAIPGKLPPQDINSAISAVVIVLPLFIAGLFIIRRIPKQQVIQKLID